MRQPQCRKSTKNVVQYFCIGTISVWNHYKHFHQIQFHTPNVELSTCNQLYHSQKLCIIKINHNFIPNYL